MIPGMLYIGILLITIPTTIIIFLYIRNKLFKKRKRVETICRPYSLTSRLAELEKLKEDVEKYYNLRYKIALLGEYEGLVPVIENNEKVLEKCKKSIENSNDPEVIQGQINIAKNVYAWFEEQNSLHPNTLFTIFFDKSSEFSIFKYLVNSRIMDVAKHKAELYERKIYSLVTNGPKLTLTQRSFIEIDTLREMVYLDSENSDATMELLNNIHYKIEDLYSKNIQ